MLNPLSAEFVLPTATPSVGVRMAPAIARQESISTVDSTDDGTATDAHHSEIIKRALERVSDRPCVPVSRAAVFLCLVSPRAHCVMVTGHV